MSRAFPLLVAVLGCVPLFAAAVDERAKSVQSAEGERPVFCAVPEMGYIPEVNSWEPCKPNDFADDAANVRTEWKRLAPWVATRVTPELARSLSRWARTQMGKYERVSPLEKVDFKPVHSHKQHGKIVLEGTVDELPSHSSVVNRWLKLYLLYDTRSKSILRVTATIRGERLE